MKRFTTKSLLKKSLGVAIVYGLVAISGTEAYGVSIVDLGAGGGVTAVGNADQVTITATGGTTVTNGLGVSGATTTNGITNTGNVGTGTLVTSGLATLDSGQVDGDLNVDGTLSLDGVVTDTDSANGTLFVNGTTAQLTNSVGTSGPGHGLFVGASSTILSGGTNSSAWTLNDGSATLSVSGVTSGLPQELISATTDDDSMNPEVRVGSETSGNVTVNDDGVTLRNNGSPARLRGVADGVDYYDAVNMHQLNRLTRNAYSGIAQIAAMTAIPAPAPGHRYAFGVGVGTYGGEQAIAAGIKAAITENLVIAGSIGAGLGSKDTPMAGAAGASLSW